MSQLDLMREIEARKQFAFRIAFSVVVNAAQMREIEALIFRAGMPVEALMEKAAILSANYIQKLYPLPSFPVVGILAGPGHNGGDALVIARELYLQGYQVSIYRPLNTYKELTAKHALYAENLGLNFNSEIDSLVPCDLIVDGLFGFGLSRELRGKIAQDISQVNQWGKPTVSIDLPSGIDTDTGAVLGMAVRATHTLCLGLWKRAFFQERGLDYIGKAIRIDFGIPPQFVWQVVSQTAPVQEFTEEMAIYSLPLPRRIATHKYQQGNLLLICGSRHYAGGAILTGLGARSSGVGMLSIVAPESLKPLLVSHLPEAIVIGCAETANGAIASLPQLELSRYDAVACGPGLTSEATSVVETVMEIKLPLVLDADGLNIVARQDWLKALRERQVPTILTPHQGEFKRLFPNIDVESDRLEATLLAARQSQSIVLLKGARTVIASPLGKVWAIGENTPALARGGSGDVLTGLIGGFVAQIDSSRGTTEEIVATCAWLHQRAGILTARQRSPLGVDGMNLSESILKVIADLGNKAIAFRTMND